MYKMKKKADKQGNDCMRTIAKLLLNALYGKTLQRAIFETSSFINNVHDYHEFTNKYNVTNW